MLAVLAMVTVHIILTLPVTVLAIIYDDVDYITDDTSPSTYNVCYLRACNCLL